MKKSFALFLLVLAFGKMADAFSYNEGTYCKRGVNYRYVCSYETNKLKMYFPGYQLSPGRPDCLESALATTCPQAIVTIGTPTPSAPVAEGWKRVRCESRGNAFAQCELGSPYPVIYAELRVQKSKAACIKDETYGFKRNAIWVDKGCRGEFLVRF